MEAQAKIDVDFDKEFMKQLNGEKLDPKTLRSFSKAIAEVRKAGHVIIDWEWLGTPRVDAIRLQAEVKNDDLSKAGTILSNDLIRQLTVFRKGIPRPFLYLSEILITNRFKNEQI